jgi:cystathionine beta-synthase
MVTLGNCLSYLSTGRVQVSSPVSKVMFSFSKLDEVKPLEKFPTLTEGDESKRSYVEITMQTPLRVLARFFEWNAAAVITEKDASVAGPDGLKAVAVATKVDLLTWLVRQGRLNQNGSK